MSAQPFDHGPLRSYEVVWESGHVETIHAHQVTWPSSPGFYFGEPARPARVLIHGHVDGTWRLLLSAAEADIRTIRDVTATERLQDGTP